MKPYTNRELRRALLWQAGDERFHGTGGADKHREVIAMAIQRGEISDLPVRDALWNYPRSS